MADIKGDATQDEIDEQIKRELAASIGSSTETNPVRLSTAAASRILELLGGPPDKPKASEQSTTSDDEPSSTRKRK